MVKKVEPAKDMIEEMFTEAENRQDKNLASVAFYRTDKLFKGGYRWHDKDSCKGAWLKRYHLQCSSPWIYQDPYDRQAHRRSEAGYDKSDSNEALRRS